MKRKVFQPFPKVFQGKQSFPELFQRFSEGKLTKTTFLLENLQKRSFCQKTYKNVVFVRKLTKTQFLLENLQKRSFCQKTYKNVVFVRKLTKTQFLLENLQKRSFCQKTYKNVVFVRKLTKTQFLLENLQKRSFCQDTSFLTWHPFPAPFLGKGVKRKVFRRKTLYLFKNTIFVRKTKSLYLFKKWLTKKNLFEGRATTQTKNGFFFLKRYFLFVSWPSLQIPFLLRKPSFSDVSLQKQYLKGCIFSKNG